MGSYLRMGVVPFSVRSNDVFVRAYKRDVDYTKDSYVSQSILFLAYGLDSDWLSDFGLIVEIDMVVGRDRSNIVGRLKLEMNLSDYRACTDYFPVIQKMTGKCEAHVELFALEKCVQECDQSDEKLELTWNIAQ